MLFTFSIYFILFCLITMLFIVISSDTREMCPEDAERLDYLNSILVLRVAPAIAVVAALLVPAVIICGV
jgi:hypothetical protein